MSLPPDPRAASASLDAQFRRAEQQLQADDFAAAAATCTAIVRLAPQHSGAHLLLSNLYGQRDRHRLATTHALAAAEKMGPQSLQHIAAVSLRLISVGEYEAAFRLIAKIDPAEVRAPPFLVEFSQQLGLLERHVDALRYLDAAIGYGISAPSIGYIRGNYLKFMGRLDDAAQEYEKSLAINPDFAYAHWSLAFLGNRADPGPRIDRIRRSLASTPTTHPERPYLFYALYKELENAGADAEAWRALEAGFRGKRAQVTFDARVESDQYDQLIAATPPGFIGASETPGDRSTPVFVLGLPRTGTSLLERILGGHADVVLCGELNDFRMQYKWVSDHYCPGFFDALALARLAAVDHADLGRRYLDHVAWRAPGARLFTDKNPGNFMMAGSILRALPHAKVIHLRRNPMDSGFSNLKELFAANAHAYSYDFADIAAHYRNYSRLMDHWHTIAPGRILDVHYEDMVSDPEAAARRVMAYLGLDYDDAQIRVEASALPSSTASSAQVRQPIHTRNIGGWKRYADRLAPLQALLGEDER